MQITKFRAFMEGYVSFLEEMAAGEQEKYAAILSYDPKRMDKVVSRQQAMNMRLTQLEEQREKEQEEAGIAGLTFQQIQDRILDFIASHSQADKKVLEELMMNTSMLSKDLGTVLVGKEAVVQGLIQEVGGISRALAKLYTMIQTVDTDRDYH